MKFTYDRRYNIAYIPFREKHGDLNSVRIGDELVVDKDARTFHASSSSIS